MTDDEMQRADQFSFQPADFPVGLNVPPGFTRADGISQPHTAETELPGVFIHAPGQVKGCSLGCIETPANTGAINPQLQLLQIIFPQAKTMAKGGDLQEVQEIALGQP